MYQRCAENNDFFMFLLNFWALWNKRSAKNDKIYSLEYVFIKFVVFRLSSNTSLTFWVFSWHWSFNQHINIWHFQQSCPLLCKLFVLVRDWVNKGVEWRGQWLQVHIYIDINLPYSDSQLLPFFDSIRGLANISPGMAKLSLIQGIAPYITATFGGDMAWVLALPLLSTVDFIQGGPNEEWVTFPIIPPHW